MNEQNLCSVIKKISEVKALGWIKTLRAGNTGVGYTLESKLGIKENNLQESDLFGFEIKTKRELEGANSSSMMTMFTLSPLPLRSNTKLRVEYGYFDFNEKNKILHATLNTNKATEVRSGNRLKLQCLEDSVFIIANESFTEINWNKERLRAAFNKKIKNSLIHVSAQSKGEGKNEEFYFHTAHLFSGFDFECFFDLLKVGKIQVDLRIGQYKNGRTHDHGTAFRIKKTHQNLLFKNVEKIV